MTDEQHIRALIQPWAIAVQDGDMETVLADHAPDIVMFDVPPPYEGVRGIEAYRDSWLPFFDWQAGGAVFDLESLDVIAGADVAFAFGLLRCETPTDLARDPQQRLRLTIGLRKSEGRWIVTHEHHSFSDTTPQPTPRPAGPVHERADPRHPECAREGSVSRRFGGPCVRRKKSAITANRPDS